MELSSELKYKILCRIKSGMLKNKPVNFTLENILINVILIFIIFIYVYYYMKKLLLLHGLNIAMVILINLLILLKKFTI